MSKKTDLNKQITMIRKVSVAMYAALAVAAAFLMSGATQQMRWFYQTKDELASQNGTVLAEGSRLVIDMPYRVALIVLLTVAVIFGGLAIAKYKKSYDADVQNKLVPWRWIYYAVTGALMVEIVALVLGVQDIAVLKLMAGATIVAALLGGIAERDNKVERKPTWKAFIIAAISGLLPWLVLGSIILGTALYGGVSLPWYAYALAGLTFAGFAATAVNQYLAIRQYKQWKDYLVTERNYVLVGFVFKTAFAVVLILAFKR